MVNFKTFYSYGDRMSRELLQQALEALEMHVLGFDGVRKMELAIEALESELAKPEQDTQCKHCDGNGCVACDARCLPEQDHGFDRTASHMAGEYVDIAEQKPVDCSWLSKGNPANAPVRITGAPPRKPWVGLTDEEIKGILDCNRGNLVDIKKAEQTLKDKNT